MRITTTVSRRAYTSGIDRVGDRSTTARSGYTRVCDSLRDPRDRTGLSRAFAENAFEIQVYDIETAGRGEAGLEVHVNHHVIDTCPIKRM